MKNVVSLSKLFINMIINNINVKLISLMKILLINKTYQDKIKMKYLNIIQIIKKIKT